MSNGTKADSTKGPSVQDLLALELARDEKAVKLLADEVLNEARTAVFRELRMIAIVVAFVLSVLGITTWLSIDDKVKSQVTTAVSEALSERHDEIQKGQNELFIKLGRLQNQTTDIEGQATNIRELLDLAKRRTMELQAESENALTDIRKELDAVRSESKRTQTFFLTMRGGPEVDRPTDPASLSVFFGKLPDHVFAIAGSSKFGSGTDGVDGGTFTSAFIRSMDEAADTNGDKLLSLSELGIACKRFMPATQVPVFGGRNLSFLAVKGNSPKKPADRKLYALLVGLNSVDPKAYGGWPGNLEGPEKDVERIRRVLEKEDRVLAIEVMVKVLRTTEATRSNIISDIRGIASRALANDVVVLFYSGHGSSYPDVSGTLRDGIAKALIAYDGEIDISEIMTLTDAINADTVIVIMDA